MKKLVKYFLLIVLGGFIGYSVNNLTKDKIQDKLLVTPNPKELKDHLRFLESSLQSLHRVKPNPIPGEWLFHNKELQQYPHQFLLNHPDILEEKREKIYIQPIGSFSPKQEEILEITTEYISVFYNVQCMILDSISSSEIPKSHRRTVQFLDGQFEKEQLQTTYIMDKILTPNLPEDARAYMGFTAMDLYPDENYNFVFGQGKVGGYVGIYSINRLGYPDWDSTEYKNCLLRTMKLATHELGHIFGFRHCVHYECIMNGSNSLEETDRKPFYLCPYDLLKVSQGLSIEEAYRFDKLTSFWTKYQFKEQADFYQTAADLIRKNSMRSKGGIHNNL
jgi:archaemetzincin